MSVDYMSVWSLVGIDSLLSPRAILTSINVFVWTGLLLARVAFWKTIEYECLSWLGAIELLSPFLGEAFAVVGVVSVEDGI